jgi:hypothetical protein
MSIDTKIIKRLDDLIELGENVLSTREPAAPGFAGGDFIDTQLANQWLTSSLNLIQRVFGKSSVHYYSLYRHFSIGPLRWPQVNQAFGVLLAAKDDFEKEALFDIKRLIEADLFDDFLEQAAYLHEAGYFQAAAVITGSVLEDGLRKLCIQNSIELPDKPKLDWMNAQLAKASVYNKLTQKVTIQG